MEISGLVRFLGSISDFKVKFDGSDIAGANMQDNGNFVVNYPISSSTGLGAHTVTVTARDNSGKTGSQTVNINVVSEESGIQVSIVSPSGGNVSGNVEIVANVTGGSVNQVNFQIQKVGGGFNTTLSDSSGSDGWKVTWNTGALSSGQYRIYVSAIKGSSTISGNTVTVSK
jgi:hypothetical protein